MLQMQDQFGPAAREFERVALMYPDEPFAPDALEAIENLDRMQNLANPDDGRRTRRISLEDWNAI